MTKFNKKFNAVCSRLAMWQGLANSIAGLDPLLKASRHLEPDDACTLNAIHLMLYKSFNLAKERTEAQRKKLLILAKGGSK